VYRLEAGSQGGGVRRHVRLDPLLERCDAHVLEPRNLHLREGHVGQVLQWPAPEQREGAPEARGSRARVAGPKGAPSPVHEALEAFEIELAVVDAQQVPGRPHPQAVGITFKPKGLAQTGDVGLQGVSGGGRR